MFKPKNLLRAFIAMSIFTLLFVGLFLQEWGFLGDGFARAAAEKGVTLPMDDPRIEVHIKKMTLSVYDGDKMVKRYDIASGKNDQPGILNREANSTPLGEFKIVAKKKREDLFSRGSRFFEIDFPNMENVEDAYEQGLLSDADYERCMTAQRTGEPIPRDLRIGGGIGIQGNFFAFMGRQFTDGSVALSNNNINEIFDHIPVGTPVIIRR